MMRLLSLILFAFPLSTPALADISNETIRAYNTAIAEADGSAIIEASKTLAAEAIANPENSQSVLLAYEAAGKLCELEQCAEAQAAARYVAASSIADPTAHPIAEDRLLLTSFANWSAEKNRKSRKAFDAALETVTSMSPTVLSIKAMQARYFYDIQQGNYRKASKSAGQAGDHMRPIADQVANLYANAELVSATSLFNGTQDRAARADIAHLLGWLFQYEASAGSTPPEWIKKDTDRAYAWGLAMDAWFQSTGTRNITASEVDEILASYGEPRAGTYSAKATPGNASTLPFCDGELIQRPRLRYSPAEEIRGFFGAVIVNFDIQDGQVINAFIGASVPSERFADRALEVVSQWIWQPASGQTPEENCSMSRTGLVQPLVFALD